MDTPPNNHVAQRLFDMLQEAELAYLMKGTRHADYLRRRLPGTLGQLRQELLKIINLGDRAREFSEYFFREFESCIDGWTPKGTTCTLQLLDVPTGRGAGAAGST